MRKLLLVCLALLLLTSSWRIGAQTRRLGREISSAPERRGDRPVHGAPERAAASRRLAPYTKDNAEWMLAKFSEWGWEARIETFDVLFPTPKERLLELVAPTRFKATLEEPAVAVDPTSGQKSRAAADLQRLLDRRRRHRRRWSTSTTAGPRTTTSSTRSASRSAARSSSPATADRGAASSRRSPPSTARSAA